MASHNFSFSQGPPSELPALDCPVRAAALFSAPASEQEQPAEPAVAGPTQALLHPSVAESARHHDDELVSVFLLEVVGTIGHR
mmetsp:Transcript_10419/g.22868  ORF Transcript_10419/g.22868 Transcript_10419/m.22868 type:complete len:83 (-) Transcript_10419:400-648(-)